jgi:hypothetical protein
MVRTYSCCGELWIDCETVQTAFSDSLASHLSRIKYSSRTTYMWDGRPGTSHRGYTFQSLHCFEALTRQRRESKDFKNFIQLCQVPWSGSDSLLIVEVHWAYRRLPDCRDQEDVPFKHVFAVLTQTYSRACSWLATPLRALIRICDSLSSRNI